MNQSSNKYVLGLDLGIASIGWSLMIKGENDQLKRIENLGVRLFSPLEDGKTGKLANQDRRIKRGQRRLRRRKTLRLQDTKKLFLETLLINFNNINYRSYSNPYEIKIKGLSHPLSKEELAIALFHYMKYRGFKSNRKVDDKKNDGVLLQQFDNVENQLKEKNLTITQYLYNQYLAETKPLQRIHNTDYEGSLYNKKDPNKSIRNKDDRYLFSATRSMYLQEITLLLDNQISYGIIDTSFKFLYLDIFQRQRSFSMGPGKGSPYAAPEGMSLISKMIGVCSFDGNPRAPKSSFSGESFVLLSFLNNIQYKERGESNYCGLTKEEIQTIYQFAQKTATLTYKSIFNVIKKDLFRIKGLELSKKQYLTLMKEYKAKKGILTPSLDAQQYDDFQIEAKKKLFSTSIVSLTNYHNERKVLQTYIVENPNAKQEIDELLNDPFNFDTISEILLQFKLDQEIINACISKGFSTNIAKAIANLSSIDRTINLSIDICKKLIPHLLNGYGYDKAMLLAGYQHSNDSSSIEKCTFLPSIDECISKLNASLTNVNVHHTLVEMRKLVNEIIRVYGYIDEFHIEFARELAKKFEDRRDIKNQQLDNQSENINLKTELIIQYPHFFHSFKDIKGDTLLKYKLYREQNGKCAYSNSPISINELFDSNATQIDHIMPYSKTFENRNFNKVLVFTSYNQNKKNRLPSEAFSGNEWQNILNFINDPNVRISTKKKETLLLKEIDSNEWLERNLNDTKYMATLSKKIIEAFLKPEKCRAVSGAITDKVKRSYGLTNLTHSLINNKYRRIDQFMLKSIAIEFNNIKFILTDNLEKEHEIFIEKTKVTAKQSLSFRDEKLNSALQHFLSNPSSFDTFKIEESIDIDKYIEQIAIKKSKANDCNQSLRYELMIIVLGEVKDKLIGIVNEKDRSNHLHHALDATIIATIDDKMIYRIQNYAKLQEIIYDENTGEALSACRFNLPYPDFRNEVIYRIYERDYETLVQKLSSLDNYQNYPFDNNHCYVINPSRSMIIVNNGPLTKETIYGYNQKKGVITKRVSVHNLDEKKIESMLYHEKGEGSYFQYLSIKKWLADGKPTQFPILPGKGNFIKKVVLEECSDVNKRVQLREKAFASNPEVIRVDLYKKLYDDNKLYFVPIYLYQVKRESLKKKGHKIQDVFYQLMWGVGQNFDYVSSEQLSQNYQKYLSLPRNSLIKLTLKTGYSGYCYSGGLTSTGNFEIYTILGDDMDLYNSKLITTFLKQYQKSIATFESIVMCKINLLGKII